MAKMSPKGKRQINKVDTPFREARIRDSTAGVTVAVFGDAVSVIDEGQVVSLKRCKLKLFDDEKRIVFTESTAMEVLPLTHEYANIEPTQDDKNAIMQQPKGTRFQLMAISQINFYFICPLEKCGKKKLHSESRDSKIYLRCENKCGKLYSADACTQCAVVKFIMLREGIPVQLTAFLPQVKQMFDVMDVEYIDTLDSTNMQEQFKQLLNKEFCISQRDDVIQTVTQ